MSQPEPHPRTHTEALGVALFVTLLWSSSWILIRWGLDGEGLQPLTFAGLRYGMASLIVVAWVILKHKPRHVSFGLDSRSLLRLALLGVLMYGLTQGAVFVALDNQPTATTSLILSMTPLLVAGAAAVTLAEIPSRGQILGALFVIFGAWLYFRGNLGATTSGVAAASVALLANTASSLLGRHVNRTGRISPVVVTAVSMAAGASILMAVGLAVEGVPSVSMRAWLIISWLAVVNTAFAFTLWNLSLRRLSAVESSGINNTMLVQIAILAWVFLNEAPGLVGIAGIGAVSIGVVLTQRVGTRASSVAIDAD